MKTTPDIDSKPNPLTFSYKLHATMVVLIMVFPIAAGVFWAEGELWLAVMATIGAFGLAATALLIVDENITALYRPTSKSVDESAADATPE